MTAQIIRKGVRIFAEFDDKPTLLRYLANHPDMVASIQLTPGWTTYPVGPSAHIPHCGVVNGTLPDQPA